MSGAGRLVEGPFFDELEVGQRFGNAPSYTLSAGSAASHQSILGERFRLALDTHLAHRVMGGSLASPSLVWNVAIGQSTLATQHVKANLFYRRLALLRQPVLGDSLYTVTTVVGLRENSQREGRPPTGLVALHIQTLDQDDRPVLDFYRCAMLPLRGGGSTGHDDDLDLIGRDGPEPDAADLAPSWDHAVWEHAVGPLRQPDSGAVLTVAGGDVVSNSPELARLTLNIAAVHHDASAAGGTRLVYGGHAIGLALSQATRALPGMATVLSWDSCDHLAPVREGDTLRSKIAVEGLETLETGWTVSRLRSKVVANDDRPVLDWTFTALLG